MNPADPPSAGFLSDADIAEFIEIVRDDYGLELPPDQAKREAEALVHFAYLLSQSSRCE